MKHSKLFSLNIWDFVKGLVVAILTPIIVFAQGYFANGSIDVELSALFAVGLSGFLAYLIKNFFSDEPKIQMDVKAFVGEEEIGVVGNRPGNRKK